MRSKIFAVWKSSDIVLKIVLMTIILFLSHNTDVFGTIRYVKAGNPTPQPPYTSWATASDSIQKCVNVSQRGDTIYVGAGEYKEFLHGIPPQVTIIGENMETTILDCRGMIRPHYVFHFAIDVSDSLSVSNFTLMGNATEENDSLIQTAFGDTSFVVYASGVLIANCKLVNFGSGVYIPKGIIRDNIMLNVHTFLYAGFDSHGIDTIYLQNNLLVHPLYSMHHFIDNGLYYPRIFVRNNIFSKPFVSSDFYNQLYTSAFTIDPRVEFSNNLFYTKSYNSDENPFVSGSGTMSFFNNVFCISEGPNREYRKDFMTSSGNVTFTNNVVYGFDKGIWNSSPNLKVNNNCFWNVPTPISGTQPPLINSENLFADPMFVKDYGDFPDVDFHLQMYSPLIDAGDSLILDRDGSRSDIGLYGGPYGLSYTYQDYAPRVPARVKLSLVNSPGVYELSWRPNTEADFNRYEVYADSVMGFIPDTTHLIWNGNDTLINYVHKKPYNKPVFFKIRAIDNQNLKSNPSEETGIVPVSVEEGNIVAEDYHLYQNYPNPFNGNTVIEYKLKTRSKVRLDIYNSNGELIKNLIDKEQDAGFYTVTLNAEDILASSANGPLSSGVYIYRINVVESERNIPVYIQSRKMVYLK
jgi:hypothetical protein